VKSQLHSGSVLFGMVVGVASVLLLQNYSAAAAARARQAATARAQAASRIKALQRTRFVRSGNVVSYKTAPVPVVYY
jgi:hypothetical protein